MQNLNLQSQAKSTQIVLNQSETETQNSSTSFSEYNKRDIHPEIESLSEQL